MMKETIALANTKQNNNEWFGTWFNSPYYHILYKNRDDKEAQNFMDNLSQYLNIQNDEKVLDLACGKGRHSIYLNQKGFDVTGIDLSEESIKQAKKSENDKLHFFVHDMRQVFQENTFDYVLNLFTSFGYFEKENENFLATKATNHNLKSDGKLVIDFLNPKYVAKNLIPYEEKNIEGITFEIRKKIENKRIIKDIEFEAEGHHYHFQEKVRALSLCDFIDIFEKSNFELLEVFGDYDLNPLSLQKSERMIFVTEKVG